MLTPFGRTAAPLAALALFLAGWAAPVQAQAPANTTRAAAVAADPARADPLDARAGVPPLVYRSSLALTPASDRAKAPTWRQANDEVARIGGWRAYAREAQQPEAVTPPVTPPVTPATTPSEPTKAHPPGAPHGKSHNGHHGTKTP